MKMRYLLSAALVSMLAVPTQAFADASEPVVDYYGDGSYSAQPETGNRGYYRNQYPHYRGSVSSDIATGVGLAIVGTIVNEAINDGYYHDHYHHNRHYRRHHHGHYDYSYPGRVGYGSIGSWIYGSTDLGLREYPF